MWFTFLPCTFPGLFLGFLKTTKNEPGKRVKKVPKLEVLYKVVIKVLIRVFKVEFAYCAVIAVFNPHKLILLTTNAFTYSTVLGNY